MRKADWPTLLDLFLASRADWSFVWGKNDCALFAADAILAMTGKDIAAPFRGRYDTEFGAARALHKIAGGGLYEAASLLASAAGFPSLRSPRLAQRGDAVLIEGDFGHTLAIVTLAPRFCVTVGQHGLLMRPTLSAITSWRV